MMNIRNLSLMVILIIFLSFTSIRIIFSQDIFKLKPYLLGQHPRILFTQAEADARAVFAKQYMPEDWDTFISQCRNIGYPTNKSILGQQEWWQLWKNCYGHLSRIKQNI